MTTTMTPLTEFIVLINEQSPGFMLTRKAIHQVTTALGKGWTTPQLVHWCTNGIPAHSNGGIIQSRLDRAATMPAPNSGGPAKYVQPKPWCGRCSNATTRWRLDTDQAVRCDCWTKPT